MSEADDDLKPYPQPYPQPDPSKRPLGPYTLPYNFHEVDEDVYRSSALLPGPSRDNHYGYISTLRDLGVKLIIDLLPHPHPETEPWSERSAVKAYGIEYVNIPMNGFFGPYAQHVAQALEYLMGSYQKPRLVHCEHGKDRTGTVIACYRMRKYGWTNKQAQQEADKFGMSAFELGMRWFIRN